MNGKTLPLAFFSILIAFIVPEFDSAGKKSGIESGF